ncbi:tellurite resistance TerB family protein [Pseudomonas palleroniana]|uniref:Tellurite resistance TerB family protein n=1 Tax=Pseudomonas palleroniana TaxID=191390 RepID=A0A0X7K6A0_9PSED|nr:tellurite resistance TerB family protein [Pseudomonas palleroniana]KWU51179.1 hypothetical protein AWV77_09385 [Pseudomonas palleroniana]
MNTRGLLDQLLKSGQDMLQNKAGGQRKQDDKSALGGLLGGGGLGSLLGGAGGGALAAGAMGLLLGNKKARKFGGKALTYGGLAALGVIAYKADGHVDERERALIEGEFTKLDNDLELQRWLHAELNKPLDPTDVARAAATPEMAAEMYIASVMLVDEENFMEKAYLDELARQLKLEPGLKAELEKQVR